MRKALWVVPVAILGIIALARFSRPDSAAVRLPPTAADTTLPGAAWLALLPDGETKRRFVLDCAGCHVLDAGIAAPDGASRSRESWIEMTDLMLSFAGAHTAFPILSPSREAEGTADWLVAHLAGRTPSPLAPLPEDDRFTVTEFDLPRVDLPHDVAVDPEGRVVVTGMFSHVMYVVEPMTGAVAEIPTPGEDASPRAVEVDRDGVWWVALGGTRQVGRYDPEAREWRTYDLGMYPHEIARDSAGRVWYNDHFGVNPERIGVLDPVSGQTRTFVVPAPPMPDGGSNIPYGLRVGADGTIWMTELTGGRLVRFDPRTEEFTLYPLPTPYSGPRRLDIASDGTIWIPEFANGRLARFDPRTERFTEYALPTSDVLPYIARVDRRSGAVWISTAAGDRLLRFDPPSETFVEVPLPTRGAIVRHLDVDPRTGDVWGAYASAPPREVKVFRVRSR